MYPAAVPVPMTAAPFAAVLSPDVRDMAEGLALADGLCRGLN